MSDDPFEGTVELPVSFRGYSRDATERLVRQLEETYRALLAERDGLRARADDAENQLGAAARRLQELEQQLALHRGDVEAVGAAVVTAERLKAEYEREAAAMRAEAAQEAARTLSLAEQQAETIMRDASARAERLVREVEVRLQERRNETEVFLDDTRERLGAIVRDLFTRVTRGPFGPPALESGEPGVSQPEFEPRRPLD